MGHFILTQSMPLIVLTTARALQRYLKQNKHNDQYES